MSWIQSGELEGFGLSIHSKFGLIKCNTCQYIVNWGTITSHLKEKHKLNLPEKEFKGLVDSVSGLLLMSPYNVNEDTINEIYELGNPIPDIPMYHDCFRCLNRDHITPAYFTSKGSFQSHHSKVHRGEAASFSSGHSIQTLFGGRSLRYFELVVSSIPQSEEEVDPFGNWLQNLSGVESSKNENRIQELWMKLTLERLSWETIGELQEGDELQAVLSQIIKDHLTKITKQLETTMLPLITKRIQTATCGKELSPLRTEQSIQIYSDTLAEFLCFIKKGVNLEQFGWKQQIKDCFANYSGEWTIERIKVILLPCLLQLEELNVAQQEFIVSDFILLSSIDTDDRSFNFTNTTQRISHLLYFMKLYVYEEMIMYTGLM